MITGSKFNIVRTEYLRISKLKAVQLQIYTELLKSSAVLQQRWFEDKHLQEVIQLLKPIILEKCLYGNVKVPGGGKTPSIDILSGSTVRIGFKFKRKGSHQTCLLPLPVRTVACEHDAEHDKVSESDVTDLQRIYRELGIEVDQISV